MTPHDPHRVPHLDAAKGLTILLVVMAHNAWFADTYTAVDHALASFRVPFFFLVAGVTFPIGRGVAAIAGQRADALLKPFVASVLLIGGWQVWQGTSSPDSVALSLVYATGFTLPWIPVWFLAHLWLVSVFSAGVLAFLKRTALERWLPLVLVVLVGGGWLMLQRFDSAITHPACRSLQHFSMQLLRCGLPYSADLLPLTSAFFLLGHLLSEPIKRMRANGWLLAAAVAGFFVLYTQFHQGVNFNLRAYGHPVISTLQALLACYAVLCLCLLAARCTAAHRALRYVGRGSLFILVFHAVLQQKAAALLHALHAGPALAGAAAVPLSVAACLLLWEAARRTPWMAAVWLPLRRPARPPVLAGRAAPARNSGFIQEAPPARP